MMLWLIGHATWLRMFSGRDASRSELGVCSGAIALPGLEPAAAAGTRGGTSTTLHTQRDGGASDYTGGGPSSVELRERVGYSVQVLPPGLPHPPPLPFQP